MADDVEATSEATPSDGALMAQLVHAATHDALTGLYNRQHAFDRCNQMFAEHPNQTFYMVHFDVQRFRLYNSFFGDAEGDNLLRFLADMIRKVGDLVEPCVFGRIEADDFMICLPHEPGDGIAAQERFLRGKLMRYRKDFRLLANNGVYVVTDRSLPAEACYNRALLAARNNHSKLVHPVKFFDQEMERKLQIEQQIGKEMQTALEQEQFEVYLQPKYVLFTGEAYGAEALVRWLHPTRGIIYPNEFIGLFESNGFIIALDRYMWEKTCRLIRKWLDEGLDPKPLSVNVSRVSMFSTQTVPFLVNLVKRYRVPVELLNLELTESAYMGSPDEMKSRLDELRAAGFLIMMDDFGSGYSSLNVLRDIPFDYLKIDRMFLASIDCDLRSRLVLASVVHMASRMGISVITEGVETDAQRDFLVSIGCDYAQGYLYAKPMPVAAYEATVLRDEPRAGRPQPDPELVMRTTMNMSPEVQTFANMLPFAVAFVDCVGRDFSYLSANLAFHEAFGMHRDIEDMSELLEHHVSPDDFERLVDAYLMTAAEHSSQECRIAWRDREGRTLNYLVRSQYLGTSDYSTILLSSFVEV